MKIYLATTLGKPKGLYRRNAIKAKEILESLGHIVFAPWETKIPGAWEMSNQEWGRKVFDSDIKQINEAEAIVALSYGRKSTAGVNWECGYAYGLGKKCYAIGEFDATDSLYNIFENIFASEKELELFLKEYR